MMPTRVFHRGPLKVKRNDFSKWKCGDTQFTIQALGNQWIVGELKKLRASGRIVEVWLSDKSTLLSVRSL